MKFRKECTVFLNHHINIWQLNMPNKASLVIFKVLKGRPKVQYCEQKYRGDKFWYRDNDNNNYCNIKYITYFQNDQPRHFLITAYFREKFFRDSEYMSLKLRPGQASTHQKNLVKRFRRRAGALRRQQLEMTNDYNKELIDEVNLDL